jgi:hypothetical protein
MQVSYRLRTGFVGHVRGGRPILWRRDLAKILKLQCGNNQVRAGQVCSVREEIIIWPEVKMQRYYVNFYYVRWIKPQPFRPTFQTPTATG